MFELYAPLTTPFDVDEQVDIAGFLRNLAWYETQPLDGYLINGSSGEADMLTPAEQAELLRVTLEHTQRAVFAGIAPTSVYAALEELKRLEGLRLEGVLVRTPSYFGSQLDQRVFYREVADRSPHRIVIYQIPQNTGVRLDERVLGDLVSHPNILGIKDSYGDLTLLQEVVRPPGFRYFVGAANLLLPALRAGANGGILALADVVPGCCRRLMDLVAQSRWEGAEEVQRHLLPLSRAIGGSRGYGIAGLKAAVERLGLLGGPPRSPLKDLAYEDLDRVNDLLDALERADVWETPIARPSHSG